MKVILNSSAALAVVLAASSVTLGASTVIYTAGTVSQIGAATPAAAPANTGISDATYGATVVEGTGLTAFNTLLNAAYTANTGGVMNFEQVDEGGGNYNNATVGYNIPSPTYSWPSQPTSAGAANGVTIGNSSANAVQVNYGASQPTSSVAVTGTFGGGTFGPPANTQMLASGGAQSITFWRDFYTTGGGVPGGSGSTTKLNYTAKSGQATQATALDGFDSNNGLNNSAVTGVQPVSGNSYFGVTSDASPVVLDFTSNPLLAFGINVINRGTTNRPLTVAVTTANGTVFQSNDQGTAGTGNAIFYGFTLTAADLAADGGIIYATLDTTGATTYNRFDDLAFIVAPAAATPEPASLGLLALSGVGMLRRRRGVC